MAAAKSFFFFQFRFCNLGQERRVNKKKEYKTSIFVDVFFDWGSRGGGLGAWMFVVDAVINM